ncbi:hypothetical protein [Neptuniibacter sp. QD37_11]|uniref:hypothetical protein n=1 Tax=Neptuniibacter sp. QD37_11 TaxID=3398209 RepID=UPI0039F5A397
MLQEEEKITLKERLERLPISPTQWLLIGAFILALMGGMIIYYGVSGILEQKYYSWWENTRTKIHIGGDLAIIPNVGGIITGLSAIVMAAGCLHVNKVDRYFKVFLIAALLGLAITKFAEILYA